MLKFSSYLLQYNFLNTDYVFFNFYLFKVSSKLTFSLLFGDLSNIDLFFTFLSIDFQPCRSYMFVHQEAACKSDERNFQTKGIMALFITNLSHSFHGDMTQ